MPYVPSISPATGKPVDSDFIHTTGGYFVDSSGRTLTFHGVNLSGSSKAPPGKPSQSAADLWQSTNDSFVGCSLKLHNGSADRHLARLRGWGHNLLRFPVTWEALEHAGPRIYDYEFMDYVVLVLRKCKEYGFRIFIDPHQDVWSRFSGGSGAPYWTLIACGFNPRHFSNTQAALIHSEYPSVANPDPSTYPAMLWSTNYQRLVSETMFTLFFGGRDFAPNAVIDGVNIQDYLEDHFLNAYTSLAKRIRDAGDLYESCVIGWDSINEPIEGLLGHQNIDVIPANQDVKNGTSPTAVESFRLGMGMKQKLKNWKFGFAGSYEVLSVTIDPNGVKAWISAEEAEEADGFSKRWGWKRGGSWKLGVCIWAQHGVWDVTTGKVLLPDYFYRSPSDRSRQLMFVAECWLPHWRRYSAAIRRYHAEAIIFCQPPVYLPPPMMSHDDLKGRAGYSPHYYDGLTLATHHWHWFNADTMGFYRGNYGSDPIPALRIGYPEVQKSFQDQLAMFKRDVTLSMNGEYPTLIGETGTPLDMDSGRSYGETDGGKYAGDYTRQTEALDASLSAADGPNALSWTAWQYCPDNSHAWGDQWNMEDLSLWSRDDMRSRREELRADLPHDHSTTSYQWPLPPNTLPSPPVSVAQMPGPDSRKGSLFQGHSRHISPSLILAATAAGLLPKADVIDPQPPRRRRPPLPEAEEDIPANYHDFLTNGARAIGAFARPYPLATVGVAKYVHFDLHQTQFELRVQVRKEDNPALYVRGGVGNTRGVILPTTIFVPLVHYASDRAMLPNTRGKIPLANYSHLTQTLRNAAGKGDADDELSMDIVVEVSEGRWEINGQVLSWWYSIPQEGVVERWIKIRRMGGPIKGTDGSGFSYSKGASSRSSCNWDFAWVGNLHRRLGM